MGKQEVTPQDPNDLTLDQGHTASMVGEGPTLTKDVLVCTCVHGTDINTRIPQTQALYTGTQTTDIHTHASQT